MGVRERFPETSWTLLAKAREKSEDGARAREDFAQRYYRPVLEFLLVLVRNTEQARDLTQDFFAKLSKEGGPLEHVRPGIGAFRDYLQQALRHLAIDYYRRNGPELRQTHPGQASLARTVEPPVYPVAEAAFHHAWVKITLAEALTQVRVLCLKRRQAVHLDLFEGRYLGDLEAAPSWEELGSRYGMDQRTARDRADTVARHFRFVLRRMLRNQIVVPGDIAPATEADIDEEIRALLSPIKD
jgi:RNA polymerase sigma-70 factor (ECF subfamily)